MHFFQFSEVCYGKDFTKIDNLFVRFNPSPVKWSVLRIVKTSITIDDTSGTETSYAYGVLEFTPLLLWFVFLNH